MSEAVRARVIEWYCVDLTQFRAETIESTTRIVVVMQRVHENDLVGYLQEQGGFEVLNLPAIAQRTETYDLGGGRTYTRQKGGAPFIQIMSQAPCARWSSSVRWVQSRFRPGTKTRSDLA